MAQFKEISMAIQESLGGRKFIALALCFAALMLNKITGQEFLWGAMAFMGANAIATFAGGIKK